MACLVVSEPLGFCQIFALSCKTTERSARPCLLLRKAVSRSAVASHSHRLIGTS